ncbi:hypothetical protein GCM10009612_28580 [Streptomyces beijiangensis]
MLLDLDLGRETVAAVERAEALAVDGQLEEDGGAGVKGGGHGFRVSLGLSWIGCSAVAEAADAFAVAAEFGAQEAGQRGDQPSGQGVEFGGGLLRCDGVR